MTKFSDPDFKTELARMRAENPSATAMFMYSPQQLDNIFWVRAMMGEKNTPTYFKGHLYSEMRQFEYGTETNFNDMVLLGVGTNDDITFGKP